MKFSAWRHKCHPPIGNNRQMEPKPRLIVHLTTVFFSFLFFFFGLLQVFVGNTDENTIVYNEFNGSIVARYTRFQPTAWHNHISMRVELYGCKGTFFVNILLLWNSEKIQTNPCLNYLFWPAFFTLLLIAEFSRSQSARQRSTMGKKI